MSSTANSNMLSLINIEKLNGNNFKAWKQKIEIHLGMLEFDLAFRLPQPTAITEESTSLQMDSFAKWERANQMSILIMQNAMEDHIRGGISSCDLAKDYMEKIEEKFKRFDKVETRMYLLELINAKYDGVGSVKEHLLKLVNLSNKLNAMDIGITYQFLVHMALFSQSNDYKQIEVSYNTQNETWDINELIAICCQEEEMMKNAKHDTIHLVHVGNMNGKMPASYHSSNYKGSKPFAQNPGSSFPPKKIIKRWFFLCW
ncbi:uncharacterized protein [Malus domestica]|uniref:uncharacterized protein n=1 Tax=Malus domestica TaxID=3750 RepID=UPI0039760310